ncbi:MAG: hypothetical protein JST04_13885 [Bdellovibrionales bacterium]|nr:hypothetical protein [Bdellovibrionales bacterium]
MGARILVVLAILAAAWFYHRNSVELERVHALEAARRADAEKSKELESEVKRMAGENADRAAKDEARRAELGRRASELEENLRVLNDRIRAYRNAGIDRAANARLAEKIYDGKSRLNSIDGEIRDARAQEKVLRENAQNALAAEKSRWRADHDERAARIAALNTDIADANARIAELKKRRFDFDAKREISDLHLKVAAEKKDLAALRESQRAGDREWSERQAALKASENQTKAITNAAVSGLADQKAAGQAELSARTKELGEVKADEHEAEKSLADLEAEKKRTQDELDRTRTELSAVGK